MTDEITDASVASPLKTMAKGGFARAISSVVAVLVNLIASVLLVRTLGVSGFGVLAFALGVVHLVSAVASTGLAQGIVRMASHPDTRIDSAPWAKAGIVLSLAGSFLGYAVCATVGFMTSGATTDALLLGGGFVFVAVMKENLSALLMARENVVVVEGATVLQRSVYVAAVCALAILGSATVLNVLAVQIGAGVIALAFLWPKWRRVLASERQGRALSSHVKRLLLFSFPLLLSGIGWKVIKQADVVMLGAIRSPSDVGLYAPILRVADLIFVLVTFVSGYYVVAASSIASDGDTNRLKDLYTIATKWGAVVTSPLLVVLLVAPGPILGLLFGPAYRSLDEVSALLVIGYASHVLVGFNSYTLMVLGETRVIGIVAIGTLIFNVILNFILITRYGIQGAALATSVVIALFNAANSIMLWRRSGVHPFRRDYLTLLLGLAGVALVAWVVQVTFSLESIYYSALVALVVLVVMSFTAMRLAGEDEREVARAVAKRLRGAGRVSPSA